jgi:hypothetical protein
LVNVTFKALIKQRKIETNEKLKELKRILMYLNGKSFECSI